GRDEADTAIDSQGSGRHSTAIPHRPRAAMMRDNDTTRSLTPSGAPCRVRRPLEPGPDVRAREQLKSAQADPELVGVLAGAEGWWREGQIPALCGLSPSFGRDALRISWRSAAPEVSDADGVGQADRRASRVWLGAPHDHGDQRLPRREATLQLVAVPVRRGLLPVLRGPPVSDFVARHVAGDGLPPSGR